MKKRLSIILAAALLITPVNFTAMADNADAGIKQAIKELKNVAPLDKDFVKYQNDIQKGLLKSTGDERNGLIPAPVKPHGKVKNSGKYVKLGLPSKYDLRKRGKMTPIRDQGPNGSCWAFSACATFESTLTPEQNDFSEKNMRNLHRFDVGPEKGGHRFMSTAYLARWSGPISEANDPYSPTNFLSNNIYKREKDLMKAVFLPDVKNGTENIDIIKRAIMENGAVGTSVKGNEEFLNRETWAHYNPNNSNPNHAVTLAGWDDNFDRHKFLTPAPRNGAWLVKNSWGDDFCDGGYFWVSYYDKNIGTYNVQMMGQATGEFDKVYQYDPFGLTNQVGSFSGYFANVFKTGSRAEQVKAVGVQVPNHDTDYVVYLVKKYNGTSSFADKIEVARGHFDYSGYYVIKFNRPERVAANTEFAPVVYYKSSSSNCIPLEHPVRNYSSKASSSYGQSFMSSNGKNFTDVSRTHSNANVCLKAFTSNGDDIRVQNVNFNKTNDTIAVGQDYQLKTFVTPDDANDKSVRFESSNTRIATVDRNGKVKAIKGGNVTITATTNDGRKTANCRLTIKEPEYREVSIETSSPVYKPGDRIIITVSVKDKYGKGVANEPLTLNIGKFEQKLVTTYKGTAITKINTSEETPEGVYPIKVVLDNNKTATAESSFEIRGTSTSAKVTVSSDKKEYKLNEDVKLFATLQSADGEPISNEAIVFSITDPNKNTFEENALTNYSGKASVVVDKSKFTKVGTYSVIAGSVVDGRVCNSKLYKFKITRDAVQELPTLTISSDKTEYKLGDKIELQAELKKANGNPVSWEKVNFEITKADGQIISTSDYTNYSGVAEVSVNTRESDPVGNYTVKAIATVNGQKVTAKQYTINVKPNNGGHENYTLNVTSDKKQYKLGDKLNFQANLKDKFGKAASWEKVNFEITNPNGKTTSKYDYTNYSGVAEVSIYTDQNTPAGTYTVQATANVNGVNVMSQTYSVKVIKDEIVNEASLVLSSDKTDYKVGDRVNLKAILKDAQAKPISWKNVNFEITKPNGQKIKGYDSTNYSGVAEYALRTDNYKSGTYKVIATADIYGEKVVSNSYTFRLTKDQAPNPNPGTDGLQVKVSSDKNSYDSRWESATIYVKVNDENGNALRDAYVVLNITNPKGSNRTFRLYTNGNGQTGIRLSALTRGNYKVTAKVTHGSSKPVEKTYSFTAR